METLLALSRASRETVAQMKFAERAREYGEVALQNVERGGFVYGSAGKVSASVWSCVGCVYRARWYRWRGRAGRSSDPGAFG
jgi:predicted lactoylglutathione lyase